VALFFESNSHAAQSKFLLSGSKSSASASISSTSSIPQSHIASSGA
jgi:hypothetical protein